MAMRPFTTGPQPTVGAFGSLRSPLTHFLRALCALLLVSVAQPTRASAAPAAPPKLVVLLVVDQMRADYIDWYGSGWKHGLRRLIDGGASLTKARYPYLETVTCAGHATIGTGAFPHTHGMVLNGWYDAARKKAVDCTDDPGAPLVAVPAGATHGGDSAKNLLAPT